MSLRENLKDAAILNMGRELETIRKVAEAQLEATRRTNELLEKLLRGRR
jgi:hypothetical protein